MPSKSKSDIFLYSSIYQGEGSGEVVLGVVLLLLGFSCLLGFVFFWQHLIKALAFTGL